MEAWNTPCEFNLNTGPHSESAYQPSVPAVWMQSIRSYCRGRKIPCLSIALQNVKLILTAIALHQWKQIQASAAAASPNMRTTKPRDPQICPWRASRKPLMCGCTHRPLLAAALSIQRNTGSLYCSGGLGCSAEDGRARQEAQGPGDASLGQACCFRAGATTPQRVPPRFTLTSLPTLHECRNPARFQSEHPLQLPFVVYPSSQIGACRPTTEYECGCTDQEYVRE